MIYIASAYTQGDSAINVKRQIDAFDSILVQGHTPIAPTLSHFVHMVHPHSYETWMQWCLKLVERCDVVVRVRSESPGADREVEYAKLFDIPVLYVDEPYECGAVVASFFDS